MYMNNSLSTRYSHKEEIANVISHFIGAIMFFVVCSCFILNACKSGDFLSILSLFLYFFGVFASYLASTLYHSCPAHNEDSKLLLRKFDHAAIYWHIAGSYSPITLIALYKFGEVGWAVAIFSLVYVSAIIGTLLTFRKMKSHSNLKTLCYVIMGLSILIAFKPFYESVGIKVVMLVVFEGISYIIGAVLYSFKKIKYIHSVFHIFVILGDVFHALAVWNIIQIYLN